MTIEELLSLRQTLLSCSCLSLGCLGLLGAAALVLTVLSFLLTG